MQTDDVEHDLRAFRDPDLREIEERKRHQRVARDHETRDERRRRRGGSATHVLVDPLVMMVVAQKTSMNGNLGDDVDGREESDRFVVARGATDERRVSRKLEVPRRRPFESSTNVRLTKRGCT